MFAVGASYRWDRFVRPAIAALAGATAIVCGLGAWQQLAPLSAPTIFPFSETYYVKAAHAQAPAAIIAYADKAIAVAPARAENWVLLAYAYQKADHHLSPRALSALRQSYVVSALSNDAHDFRLSEIFANWPVMPDDIRGQAITEARMYVDQPKGQALLSHLQATVPDLGARLTLGMIQFEFHRRIGLSQ